MSTRFQIGVFTALLCLVSVGAFAHPVPDIPVRGYFHRGGEAVLKVEIDLRCFAEDPENEPYLLKWVLDESSEAEKREWIQAAEKLTQESITFHFEPLGRTLPEFAWNFTSHAGKELSKEDDPVVLTGEWRTTIPTGVRGYRIKATEAGELAIPFINHFDGRQIERLATLFPGEESFLLDLSGHGKAEVPEAGGPDAPADAVGPAGGAGDRWAALWDSLKVGFIHVAFEGPDHVLFVLGLFLLSRKWRPLLWQVSMFTLAHTFTLFLSALGLVRAPTTLVETVIAASIAYVAIENICREDYSRWRLLVVFAFGLVHGLGFAGRFAERDLSPANFVTALIGFNVGVEFAQLAVLAIAFGVTIGFKDPVLYRKRIIVPGSAAIGLLGVLWALQRLFGS